MNSRPRRICCLILMAYPSLALAVSTLALMTCKFVCTSQFRVVNINTLLAFFIAGFTSDKLFVKIMTASTYLALLFLGALAVYVFSERIKEYVILHVTHWLEINLGAVLSGLLYTKTKIIIPQISVIAGFLKSTCLPFKSCLIRKLIWVLMITENQGIRAAVRSRGRVTPWAGGMDGHVAVDVLFVKMFVLLWTSALYCYVYSASVISDKPGIVYSSAGKKALTIIYDTNELLRLASSVSIHILLFSPSGRRLRLCDSVVSQTTS